MKTDIERNLYQLSNEISATSTLLNSFHISCDKERREIENLCNEKARLEAIVTGFKNNNVEYLKLRQAAEEKVKDVLTNSKLLLKFATASVIESLRRNPELCNFLLNDISNNNHTTPYGSNCLLLMLPGEQQSSIYISDDICTAVIIEEAEKLYNKLTTKLTDDVMAAAADIRPLSLPSTPRVNNKRQN